MTMTPPSETRAQTLRRRAIASLERSKYPMEAEQLLERLVEVAIVGSEDALFAHRRLAELYLERNPWRAALHLRHVVAGRPEDPTIHALLGLCHGLLKNYRVAVASYERAITFAPNEAGYLHNLGHLIDIGLGEPLRALRYLEAAVDGAPQNGEIWASLAQCFAHLGRLEQALEAAKWATQLEPQKERHRTLVAWIQDGAPDPRLDESGQDSEDCLMVRRLLEQKSPKAYAALRLAAHFFASHVSWTGTSAMAAAIDYLSDGTSQKRVAARYGVSTTTLARRVHIVRDALPELHRPPKRSN